ncbi:MAG TPA: hypothetical protein VF595_03425 [Tepidisphaeraceae bacterium]
MPNNRGRIPPKEAGLIKSIVQWIIGGATVLAVVAAGVAYFDLPAEQRSAMWQGVGRVMLWAGIVLVLPWATYFVTTAAARRESNAAGVALVAAYTAVDALLLYLLVGRPAGTFAVLAVCFGLLVSLAYNLLTCDWIAERGT